MILLIKIFLSFLRIGLLGFGGGYAMLSIIIEDAMSYGLTIAQVTDLNALDMLVPGPISINAATYVGYLVAGFWGATVASIGVSIPSFIFIYLFGRLEDAMKDGSALRVMLKAVKVAVVGVISGSVFMLLRELVLEDLNRAWFVLVIFVVSIVIQIKKDINPIFIIIASGLLGNLLYYVI